MASGVEDHYATLGVAAGAASDEIRSAYRQLARQRHPDRVGDDGAAMAALNEAYRVLGDPGRRAMYDAGRRSRSSASASSGSSPSWVDAGARRSTGSTASGLRTAARVPWRTMLVMFGVGATAVVVLAALTRPSETPPPDNLIDAGSCVVVEPNGDAREVSCPATDDDGGVGDVAAVRVVRVLVESAPECPAGTDAHRDRQGRGIACLEPPGASVPTG